MKSSLYCSLIVLYLALSVCQAQKFINQISRQGEKLINEAQNGKKIRQCSCEEQDECVAEIELQVGQCFDSCWKEVKKVSRPDDLKKCFKDRQYIVDNLLECAGDKMKTCVPDKDGKDVPYIDFNVLLTKGEKKILQEVKGFSHVLEESGKAMIDTGLKVGSCMKTCFLEKNVDGFCWDQKKCQPMIDAHSAGKAIKQCIRKIGWKKEASDICECMVQSGVDDMKQYCTLLETMARRHRA